MLKSKNLIYFFMIICCLPILFIGCGDDDDDKNDDLLANISIPAIPAGIKAVSEGDSVTLTWQASAKVSMKVKQQ